METESTWNTVNSCPDAERNATIETTATETGDAQMPICDATDETAIGRSGRMPCLMAIS